MGVWGFFGPRRQRRIKWSNRFMYGLWWPPKLYYWPSINKFTEVGDANNCKAGTKRSSSSSMIINMRSMCDVRPWSISQVKSQKTEEEKLAKCLLTLYKIWWTVSSGTDIEESHIYQKSNWSLRLFVLRSRNDRAWSSVALSWNSIISFCSRLCLIIPHPSSLLQSLQIISNKGTLCDWLNSDKRIHQPTIEKNKSTDPISCHALHSRLLG